MSRQKALNQDNLRAHNIGVVLSSILRSNEPVSRAHISRSTGMTKAAISIIVSDLIAHDVLKEGKPQQLASTGKPSNPLEFVDGAWLGLGVQVHTDGYGFMLQDFNGHVVDSAWVAETEYLENTNKVLADLEAMIDKSIAKLSSGDVHILGGGLAIPGMVTNRGILVDAPNLGWHDINLMETSLVQKYDLIPLNEANLAAITQIPGFALSLTDSYQENARLPDDSFIFISTDVGIGGAYVDRGSLISGMWGVAGEIGHISVTMDGALCRCGRRGCMEMFAGRHSLLHTAGCVNASKLDAQESFEWIRQHREQEDIKAHEAINDATRAMASAIVSTINIVDITKVIIGGFWTRFGQEWLSELRASVSAQLKTIHKDKLEILFSTVDDHAALHGSAEYGLRRLVDNAAQYLHE